MFKNFATKLLKNVDKKKARVYNDDVNKKSTKSQQKGGDIMTNTRLLEEIIDKSGLKRGEIASELELSYSALNKKN